MIELVRAGALRNFAALVSELGGEPDSLLGCVKLPPSALDNPDDYIDFGAMISLLERSANELNCMDFGLRLAQQQDFDMFGPVALAAQNCVTLGDAIECTARFFYTHNPHTHITLEPRTEELARVCVTVASTSSPMRRQVEERNAYLAYQALLLLSSNECRLLRVTLPHEPLSPCSRYRAVFDHCPVAFEQDCVSVEFRADELRLPIRERNQQLRRVAIAFLESQWQHPRAALSVRVRETIKAMLPTGRCMQTNLADALSLHPRSLQRRLADEGTSFELLKEEVRRDYAEHYLKNTRLPLSQVAALLGYSEQSALTRSCRRWFQAAPLAFRRAGTAHGSPEIPD